MAKRLFSWVLVLALVLSMVPAITLGISAEGELDKHTSHEGWTEWTDATKLPSEAGKYYLSADVDLTAAWTVPTGDTHLCLNGHHITQTANARVISVRAGNSLSIYDCAKAYEDDTYVGGTISGGKKNDHGHGVWVARGTTNEDPGVFNLYGGRITGNKYTGANARGGAVYLQSSKVNMAGGVFNMYGGELYDNQASLGGAVYIHGESAVADRGTVYPTFNMYGGKIHGNTATYYKNTSNENAGGIGTIYAIGNAIVNIQGGEITGNTSDSHGSVIYALNSVKLTVKNAKVTENVSGGTGTIYAANSVELNVEGSEITGNRSYNASAIYAQNDAVVTVKDSTITENVSSSTSAEGYGAALYICGGGTKVIVSGKTFIADNVMKNEAIADLFINSSATGAPNEMLYVKDLNGYVKFGVKDKAASVTEASDIVTFEGAASTYAGASVSYMAGTEEKHVGLVDGSFKFVTGHFHEGVEYTAWTDGTTVPSSGTYYLDTDITVGTRGAVQSGATLKLCMNGHTIKGNGKTTDAMLRVEDGSAYISDCTTKYDENGYFVSGGKFENGLRKGNGAAIYANKATSVLVVEGVAFVGNNSTETSEGYGGGAVQVRENTTPAKFIGCLFDSNTSSGGAGALSLRDGGDVILEKCVFTKNTAKHGGAIYITGTDAKPSSLVVDSCKITENTATNVGGINILGISSVIIKDTVITGNSNTSTDGYGAVNLGNSNAVVKIQGNTVIYDNLNKDQKQQNLHAQQYDGVDYDLSGLGANAKIGVSLIKTRIEAGYMYFSTTGMTAVPSGVTSDDTAYEVVVDNQGRLALAAKGSVTPPVTDTHTHKLCNDAACTAHGADVTFEKWTDSTTLPTSGNYYLDVDVNLTAAVDATGDLNLCLNGHTIKQTTSGKLLMRATKGYTLSITDCGTTGKLTGGSSAYGSAISVRHGSVFNLYGGKITGNTSTSEGTVYIQGGKVDPTDNVNEPVGGTFNMYGGEISGNKTAMGGAVSIAAPVGTVTTPGTLNIYGGKLTGNTTTGRGGAINASGKATIYIENAEISGNTAGGEGTIYATTGPTLTVKNAKIQNNNAKTAAAISTYGGIVTLDGAVIENNHATGGYSAVHAAVSAIAGTPTVVLKGATVITGNTNGTDNVPMNLYLRNNVMVDVSGLTDAAKIGLTRSSDRAQDRVSTAALGSANELARFESDDALYTVERDAEGYLVLLSGTAHRHKLCNDASCTAHGGDVAFRKWSATDSLPTSGYYYLDVDVNLTAVSYANGNLVLCLNGHTITQTKAARVLQTQVAGSTLTVTDCGTTGTITGGRNDTGASIFITDSTTFNLYAGKITGSAPASSGTATSGSAIFLRSTSGDGATFNMYGGEITGNGDAYSWGGAIGNGSGNANNCVYVNIYGGKIYGNAAGTGGAIRMMNKSVTTIYGGEIYGNEAATTGGAIYLGSGSPELVIQGGKIYDNTAATAGGIYVHSSAKVTVSGNPVVYDNTVDGRQNNLYMTGSTIITLGDVAADAKIGVTATSIGRAISMVTENDYTVNFVGDMAKQPITYKDKTLWIDARVETSDHLHSACTGVKHGSCEHDADQMWVKWGDDEDEINTLPTTSGYYYLTRDIQMSTAAETSTSQEIYLCLNGKTVTAAKNKRHLIIGNYTEFSITDCAKAPGGFTGGSSTYGGSINVTTGSTLNLYAGRFYGNNAPDNEGGAIYLQGSKTNSGVNIAGGVFNMYGGEIYGNTAKTGAGIRAAGIGTTGEKDPSIVNIYGGKIHDNYAKATVTVDPETQAETKSGGQGGGVAITASTEMNFYGGTITGNTSDSDGGGIYMNSRSDLYINGGKIEANVATGNGGGIFMTGTDSTVIMDSGTISGNSASNGGGMITQTQSFFTMNGGTISGNTVTNGGAGIYVSTNTDFVMNGGKITGNSGKTGGGFYALRSRVTLNGGEVSKNVASYRAGGFASSGATVEINAVTIKSNEAPEGGAAYINRTSSGSGENITYYPSIVNINDGALITGNKGGTNTGGLLIGNDDVVVTMNGGEISKNTATNGAGFMTWRGSTFIVKGGKIVNNTATNCGGGGYVSTGSTFKMEGGSISNNKAKSAGGIYVYRSEATFSGGTVSNNRAQHTSTKKDGVETKSGGTAGAMYISGAKVNLRGTSFTGNYSTVNGGAIMMGRASYTENDVMKYDNATVNVYGGLYSGNKTAGAGGVMLIQSEGTVVNVYGGTFTDNEANNAGAIYVSTKTKFNMTGGVFTRNHANAAGGALYFLKSTGTVTGGLIYANTATSSAGGVMVSGDICNVTIKNMKFHDFKAKTAGVLVVQSYGHVFVENCDFYDNVADGGTGGAVYISNNSYGDFTDCKFYNNASNNASGAMHAAINSKINVTRCDFTENTTETNGGAMYCNPKTVINITDSTFSKNTATINGGALVCRSTMYLTNVTIENCSAEYGGAIATDTNNTGGAGVLEGLVVKNCEIRNNTANAQGGAFYIWKGRPVRLFDTEIKGNTAGAEGGAIWAYEDTELHSTKITGNTSGGEGYAVYMNDAMYDGHSYYTSKNKLSGDTVIKDNEGGDLWMGPDVTFVITADGLGENAHIELVLDSGMVTNRILGAYNYEGGNQVYTITYGDRSMTDPEYDASLAVVTEEQTDQDAKTASGDVLLYVGIGIIALAIIAVGVILATKKKKAGKPAEEATKE